MTQGRTSCFGLCRRDAARHPPHLQHRGADPAQGQARREDRGAGHQRSREQQQLLWAGAAPRFPLSRCWRRSRRHPSALERACQGVTRVRAAVRVCLQLVASALELYNEDLHDLSLRSGREDARGGVGSWDSGRPNASSGLKLQERPVGKDGRVVPEVRPTQQRQQRQQRRQQQQQQGGARDMGDSPASEGSKVGCRGAPSRQAAACAEAAACVRRRCLAERAARRPVTWFSRLLHPPPLPPSPPHPARGLAPRR